MREFKNSTALSRGIDDPHDYFHHIEVPPLSQDLIVGAESGSVYLFGEANTRRFYHLVSKTQLPTARVGSMIAIQKSVIRAFLWQQQSRSFANDNVEPLIRLRLLLVKFLELYRPVDGGDHSQTQLAYVAIELAKIIQVLVERPK